VGDGVVGAGGDADVEVLGHLLEGGLFGDSEIPVGEGLFGVAADVLSAVGSEALRGVVVGVEADAEEVGFVIEPRGSAELPVDVGKVAGDAGAEVGTWAAGVNEGDEEGFALELGDTEGFSILVAELEVWDLISLSGNMIADGWAVVRFALGDYDDVVEENVGIGVLGDEYVGGDDVGGVEFGEDAGVFELVGHGHGVHEAGDCFVVQGDLAGSGIGGDDLSAQLVDLEVLRGGCGGFLA